MFEGGTLTDVEARVIAQWYATELDEAATVRVDANAEIDPEFGTLVPGSAQVRGS